MKNVKNSIIRFIEGLICQKTGSGWSADVISNCEE